MTKDAFPFTPTHKRQGKKLLDQKKVRMILFSQGTYQVEMEDPTLKESVWPFLKLNDQGHVRDHFCTCQTAEKEHSCPHLAAAFLLITRDMPLHMQFQSCLWNALCSIAFRRLGSDPKQFIKQNDCTFSSLNSAKKVQVCLELLTPQGHSWFQETVQERPEETEETSLKLASISADELDLWKQGAASTALQYELSFWSDIAKWMLSSQTCGFPYEIAFTEVKGRLPTAILLTFLDVRLTFFLKKSDWKQIIPTLQSVDAPLKVHPNPQATIKKASYDPARCELTLTFHKEQKPNSRAKNAIEIGPWEFRPGEGFFAINPKQKRLIEVIPPEKISAFLSHHSAELKNLLVGSSIRSEKVSPSYELFFDSQHQLHICAFAFTPGDLTNPTTTLFLPWAYTKNRGFFFIDSLFFENVLTIIPKESVEEFMSEHRLWLNQYEGFHLHVSPIDFQLSYSIDKEKTLHFFSEIDQISAQEHIIEFAHWLYLKGKGFYKKEGVRKGAAVTPGMSVEKNRISSFIHANLEELETVKQFFSSNCPIQGACLSIVMTEDDHITITPHYRFSSPYQAHNIEYFGDFTYVMGEGFAEIPPKGRLPEKYQCKVVITRHKDSPFVFKELPTLAPFIETLDRRLQKPQVLNVHVKTLQKNQKHSERPWIIDLIYASELGETSVYQLKQCIDNKDPYATTKAGLLFLEDPRFDWLRELKEEQIDPENQHLTLSTLEWLRLRIFEKVQPPVAGDAVATHTRALIEELDHFEPAETLLLKGLKSTLRPYQEIGVKWLWFLYSYGLSGLLCDDMGLGKTHQAMGLLAAAKNAQHTAKGAYLIVCPTSVLYHWEALLAHFLPKFSVAFFYGPHRSLSTFHRKKDILLTSYGVVRSEKKNFQKLQFDIAIFDEIQMGKNVRSQTHQALTNIRAHTKIGLTGTPIENRLLELKALFDIVLPGYFPSLSKYREQFVQPIEKYQEQGRKTLLADLIHPFVLRRKKSDVLDDLPEKTEEIAYCFLSEEQRRLYRDACVQSRSLLVDTLDQGNEATSYLHIFSLFNTLKQICNHPSLHHKDPASFKEHASGKWDLFVELLLEACNSGQKLVVFTQYLGMMKIIALYLKEQGIDFAAIQGETRNRKQQLDRFRDDDACRVFIASLRAVGTGVDLTAGSVVIHYDRWWNPAREDQATDRVHRIGQNRGVQVFKLVTKQTIEDHIHQLIMRKTGLLEGVVGYDDQDQIKRLSQQDIATVLKQIHQSLSN